MNNTNFFFFSFSLTLKIFRKVSISRANANANAAGANSGNEEHREASEPHFSCWYHTITTPHKALLKPYHFAASLTISESLHSLEFLSLSLSLWLIVTVSMHRLSRRCSSLSAALRHGGARRRDAAVPLSSFYISSVFFISLVFVSRFAYQSPFD